MKCMLSANNAGNKTLVAITKLSGVGMFYPLKRRDEKVHSASIV